MGAWGKIKKRRRFSPVMLGGALLTILVAAVLTVMYVRMSRPQVTDSYLGDNLDGQNGWSYQLLRNAAAAPAEPVLLENGYQRVFEERGITAVKATRRMTETLEQAELSFERTELGIEVFFNDTLLYSDFAKSMAAYQDGFLRLSEEERETLQTISGTVTLTLPDDYTGGELTVAVQMPRI